LKLEELIKDIALNLNSTNYNDYKEKAMIHLLKSKPDFTGDEASIILNAGYRNYEHMMEIIGTKTLLKKLLKKMMKETDYPFLLVTKTMKELPEIYSFLNEKTKKEFFSTLTDFTNIDKKQFKDFLDNYDQIWFESNMTNRLGLIIRSGGKPWMISMVVNHPRFKSFPSQYKTREVLIDYPELIENRTIFKKLLNRNMAIIDESRGWNTDFSDELAPIITNKYFEEDDLSIFTEAQQKAMLKYTKENAGVNHQALVALYNKFNDSTILPDELKSVFIF